VYANKGIKQEKILSHHLKNQLKENPLLALACITSKETILH
jgi:hypothetical protein